MNIALENHYKRSLERFERDMKKLIEGLTTISPYGNCLPGCTMCCENTCPQTDPRTAWNIHNKTGLPLEVYINKDDIDIVKSFGKKPKSYRKYDGEPLVGIKTKENGSCTFLHEDPNFCTIYYLRQGICGGAQGHHNIGEGCAYSRIIEELQKQGVNINKMLAGEYINFNGSLEERLDREIKIVDEYRKLAGIQITHSKNSNARFGIPYSIFYSQPKINRVGNINEESIEKLYR